MMACKSPQLPQYLQPSHRHSLGMTYMGSTARKHATAYEPTDTTTPKGTKTYNVWGVADDQLWTTRAITGPRKIHDYRVHNP